MLLLAWIMFEQNDYSLAAVFSIGYALTKAGSVISGCLLFIYALYRIITFDKSMRLVVYFQKFYRELFYFSIIGFAILTMVFSGKAASGETAVIFGSVGKVVEHMFSRGWMSLMPMGGAIVGNEIYTLKFEAFF